MTVCIAVVGSGHIVAVSDLKVTAGGYYSQDIATIKVRKIAPRWWVMISGNFGHFKEIHDGIRKTTSKDENLRCNELAKIATEEYIKYTRKLAEETILSPYGMTMEEFLKSRQKLGNSLYERMWGELSRIELGCDFLFFGFEGSGAPRIFVVTKPTVDRPGFVTYYDSPGFAAIGTGSVLAESTLHAFRHNIASGLSDTIYHATYAKFVAEGASDVGEATHLKVWRKDGSEIEMDGTLPHRLRQRYFKQGRPVVPEDVRELIDKAVKAATPQTDHPEEAPTPENPEDQP